MRRELLRQIAWLEGELCARSRTWRRTRVTPLRGPAVQSGQDLERIRDELLAELGRR